MPNRFGGFLATYCGTVSCLGRGEQAARRPGCRQSPEALDGDTFAAEALVWPGHTIRVKVRIRGINAPEMRSRCAVERQAALKARDERAGLIGQEVSSSNSGGAKLCGRVLADVATGMEPPSPRSSSSGLWLFL